MECTNPTRTTTVTTKADLDELTNRPDVHLHSDVSNHTWAWEIRVEYCENPKNGPSGHQD
jgi:hypothetical protein